MPEPYMVRVIFHDPTIDEHLYRYVDATSYRDAERQACAKAERQYGIPRSQFTVRAIKERPCDSPSLKDRRG